MSRTSFRAPGRRRHVHRRSRAAVLAVLSLVGSFAVVAPAGVAGAAPSKVTQPVHAAAAQAGGFVPLSSPQRLLDTRNGGGCVATTRTLTVTGVAGIPSGAPAVVLNVAAVGALIPGFLRTYPADQSPPSTSTMNFQAAQGISNAVVAKPSAAGAITFQAMAGTCPHVVVDVTGYFTSGSAGPGGYVAASTPQRLLDTRSGGGACLSSTRTLQLAGVSGIPADASSVFVNVAAVTPTAAGTLRLMPSDTDFVSGVNVTYNPGINVSTASVVKPGADGAVKVAASGGCTHVVVDVVGWTTSGTSGIGGVVPLTNRRIMDTRPAGAGGCVTVPRELVVSPLDPDLGGVPQGAGSVLLAVTATGAATAGFGRVYPGGQPEPPASTINYQAGASITNLVMARVGSGGAVMFSAQAGSCPHLIVELLGYTVGDPATVAAPVTYTQVDVSDNSGNNNGHTCAVTSTSQVRCWGQNGNGQLGNGTQVPAAAPVGVVGLPATAQVGVGFAHGCVRSTVGGVWCWGKNYNGQLGVGTTVDSSLPRQLFIAGVSEISAGGDHTCARISDGTVRCWGSNWAGQLGLGRSGGSETAPVVVPGLSGVLAVRAGAFHTCALITGGTVRCWGYNASGQLGDGTTTNRSTPVTVSGVSGATQLAVGGDHACVLVAGGAVRCWGSNFQEQLGDGTYTNRPTPVTVAGISGATQLSAGSGHSCAKLGDGSVKCWGTELTGVSVPTTVAGVSNPSLMASGRSVCFLTGGRIDCARATNDSSYHNGAGVLGWTTDAVLTQVSGASQVATGDGHACALVTGGAVKCWGYNYYGTLGNGTNTSTSAPATVSGVSGATQLGTGYSFACALTSGTVKCWGRNADGQLGDGTTTNRSTPVTVSGVSGATQLAVGGSHACALVAGGAVKCWGANWNGQLGDGTTTNRSTPVSVSGLTGATQLTAGSRFACAIVTGGAVRCWGTGTVNGGSTSGPDRLTPVAVPGISGATALSSGYSANGVCATVASNQSCWGQLPGGGAISVRPLAGFTGAAGVSLSMSTVCAVVAGAARCWGKNYNGQLGDRTARDRGDTEAPSTVASAPSVVSVSNDGSYGCAVTSGASGVVRCWGSRSSGRMGVPWVETPPNPARVVN